MKDKSFAIISGLFAAAASILGKLSLNSEEFNLQVCGLSNDDMTISSSQELCQMVGPVVQLGLFALIFVCNALMWMFLSKAMDASETSGEVLAVNSATNFLFVSVVGFIVFKEKLTSYWLMGSIVTLIGLSLIYLSSQESDASKPKDD